VLGVFSTARLHSVVEIEHAYTALLFGQIFFLVFLGPLFERRPADVPGAGAIRLVGLWLLSAPLVFLALRTSTVAPGNLIRSQLLVLLVGAAAGAAVRLPRSQVWYYPAAFLLAVVLPFVQYLMIDVAEASLGGAAASVSPFWAALCVVSGRLELAPLFVFAGLAAGALALNAWLRSAAGRTDDA